MLFWCFYIVYYIVYRISFEKKPQWYVVSLEIWLDAVFFVDMMRNFTQPYKENDRYVYDRKAIAIRYIKTWFGFDLYAFFPLAYLRYISNYDKGDHNE